MTFKLLFIGFLICSSAVYAQDEIKRNLHFGNEAFVDADYEKAAAYYLDAVDESPLNFKANYNLANAYFRMNQFDQAIERMNTVINLAPTSFDKAKAYHNIGNAHMMKQAWDDAIDAYKSSLRLNPSDEETRYNLAYALEMKRQQDEQENQENSDGSDGNEMGDSGNENNNDSENSENDNSDSENSEDKNQDENSSDEKNSDKNDAEQNGNAQNYEAKLSKDQIKNILDSYYLREKELLKRINKNKRAGYGSPKKKDW
jgi:Ca-activated chloride channel homolog